MFPSALGVGFLILMARRRVALGGAYAAGTLLLAVYVLVSAVDAVARQRAFRACLRAVEEGRRPARLRIYPRVDPRTLHRRTRRVVQLIRGARVGVVSRGRAGLPTTGDLLAHPAGPSPERLARWC